eukprot:COSAG02_NODE_2179_length_9586_cov_14.521395_8_plen_130_part_00
MEEEEGHSAIAVAQRTASSGLDSRTFFCSADFNCDGESVWRPTLPISLLNAITKPSPSSADAVNALSRIVRSRPEAPVPLRGLLVNLPSHRGLSLLHGAAARAAPPARVQLQRSCQLVASVPVVVRQNE